MLHFHLYHSYPHQSFPLNQMSQRYLERFSEQIEFVFFHTGKIYSSQFVVEIFRDFF